jgi:hypothetical protein
MYPSEKADKFVVRLPDGMRDRIRQQAAATRRTMNSLIIHALDRALAAEEAKSPAGASTPPSHDQSHHPAKDGANDERD